jgi:hypothetical protein
MVIRGDEARALHDELVASQKAERERRLAAAIATATAKQPFDLEEFDRLYPGRPGSRARADREADRTYQYYVDYPDALTVAEFVDTLVAQEQW